LRAVLALAAAALVSCHKDAPSAPPVPADSELAWQRVALQGSDGGEVAFLVGLPKGSGNTAVVVSGTDRIVGHVAHDGPGTRVEFPLFSTMLALTPEGAGYTGSYQIKSLAWGEGTIPLRAGPVAGPTIAAQATLTDGAPIDFGTPRTLWRLRVGDIDAKLALDQVAPGEVNGTLYFDSGAAAYFGGSARGDRVLLAGFDGATPFRLDVTLDASRQHVTGSWRAGPQLGWQEQLTGDRQTSDFELGAKIVVDPEHQVLRHPALKEFDGKPLIVELAGSWCPTCKFLAPTLHDIYGQYHSQGLEVVSLLYELTADPAANKAAETAFRNVHHATWIVRAVPANQDELGDKMPEGISNIDVGGFPIVVFRRRDGTIAGIHSGFPSSKTGAPYQATIAKFQRLTAEILAK
jgi:thiol-disulfide isomerase/thioredoxin